MNATATERWTYESDSCGYMLYFDGKPQGGARTLGTATHTSDGRVRHWKHRLADLKMHAETASRECERRNAEGRVPAKATAASA
jgi:hypothetical protein